ncbi:MAG: hypothetical protein FGM37_02775 [Phycisphaerales bacterium]|nr:hypothetical protein [Phycisphaerales bacterium]
MIHAIAAFVLSAPPLGTTAEERPASRGEHSAPAVVVWDEPRRAGEMGQLATIWTPLIAGKVPHQSDLEMAVALDMIEQAKLGDEVVAVIGGDAGDHDGGIAGGGPTIILTLLQAPSSVVIPAQASLERVRAYLESILADQVSLRIGIAFRSTGAPNILGVTASRWAPQPVSPSLASMIRAGSAQGTPDDARFLPEPPAPYGAGPVANSRMRVMYTAPQSSNRPRFASEDRIYWTYPQLKAAWQYALPTSTSYDAQISINTNAAIFQNLDFDPSDGIPAGKYSFEDLVIRQIVQSLGWTCAASANLRQEMSVMDLYRFSADRVSLASADVAPDTGTGFMVQPPDAFFRLTGCTSSCEDIQSALDSSVAGATPYTDPELGNYRVDLNPGVMRPLRFSLVNEAFGTLEDQQDFVSQFLPVPPASSGFGNNRFGWAVRLQFGGPGIWDDAQLTPPPAPALRTTYTDAFSQRYRTQNVGTNGAAAWAEGAETWSSLDEGFAGAVNAFVRFDPVGPIGPMLYAAGSFRSASGVVAERIARWNGSAWEPVGGGFNGTVHALAVFDDGSGEALYAGGIFSSAGGVAANRIAKWNGTAWSAVGAGFNNAVNALTVHDDGGGLALYAGGAFTLTVNPPRAPAPTVANRIAKWNGTAWSAVGNPPAVPSPGLRQAGLNGTVTALDSFDPDGSGPIPATLIAGGTFSTADSSVIVSNIAEWDGTAWSRLGTVGDPGMNAQVWALTSFDPDGDGGVPATMVAGGDFTSAGGVAALRIASWDGTAWSPLGAGANGSVRALAELDNGVAVMIAAGGDFTSMDGVSANRFAYRNGLLWEAAGDGLSCTVNAITQEGIGPTWRAIAGGAFSGDFCVLVDFVQEYPGYTPRLVAMGMADGLVNLNFVTGVDGDPNPADPLIDDENSVDLEVPILSNQTAFSSFLVQVAGPPQTQYLMGDQQLPQATTYFSRSGITGAPCNPTGDFLSPTELKILGCLGWAINDVPTPQDCP